MPSCFRCRSPDVQIRFATSADVPHLRRLEQESHTAAHWSEAQYDSLFAPEAGRIAILAEDEPRKSVAGFLIARCLPDEWEVENLVVAAASRRLGIGRSLVRALLDEARVALCPFVLLEVRESNEPARRLYENMGFKPQGRRSAYYDHPPENAILYRISLRFCDKIC
jgi:ribosomal-protein-alanine acetyltransferase